MEVLKPVSSVKSGIVIERLPCVIVAVPVIGSITVFRFVLAFTFVRALVAVPCLIVLKVLFSLSSVGKIEGAILELAGLVSATASSKALRVCACVFFL